MNQDYLKSILTYDPKLGLFHWKVKKRRCKIGQVAGCVTPRGIVMKIDGKIYMARRLAWLYMTGSFPNHGVTTKDGHSDNDAWDNLKLENRRYRYEN